MNAVSMTFSRDQVLAELEKCQDRVMQTLVPTIISVGLISIADRENVVSITLFACFAVLFSSSLYVASLSHKIFRNTTFIQALNEQDASESDLSWWAALSKFQVLEKPIPVIGFETTTISVVYGVFSIAFFFMFQEINFLLSLLLGLLLQLVSTLSLKKQTAILKVGAR